MGKNKGAHSRPNGAAKSTVRLRAGGPGSRLKTDIVHMGAGMGFDVTVVSSRRDRLAQYVFRMGGVQVFSCFGGRLAEAFIRGVEYGRQEGGQNE